jgi:hypothetical protein
VKIDFCEADVLDVFDEWRRATGVTVESAATAGEPRPASRQSLPAHLERVVIRLTSLRAQGSLGEGFDALIDRVARELDMARADARGVRGDARHALLDRLGALDAELLREARLLFDEPAQSALGREADEELAPFRSGMNPDTLSRARDAAIDRLVRERVGLPTITFT